MILFIAFGSLVAMGLPIATALLAIVGGLALMKLVGHLVPAPNFALTFGAMIGLGVGIDYALFIVTRYKDGLAEGDDPESATAKAVATAGHVVLFAGTTVVIALMGLLVMGQRLMTGLAVATSLTVLVTMIAALTLLPAFLGRPRTRGSGAAARSPSGARPFRRLGRTTTKPQVVDLGLRGRADDGNRTRATSLGITRHLGLRIASDLQKRSPGAAPSPSLRLPCRPLLTASAGAL
ncbi:MMPL family transporter [Streptomyces sp. NPDC053792]|uniref:MMPL family transporter n=1 Tax=Streptomyces sp. NPDC053792 TaxID=3365716 RepID=UPI0037CFE7FF